MSKDRFFCLPPAPSPPDDLKALQDWVVRLELHLQQSGPNSHSCFLYRPHREADRALLRLSVQYAEPVRQLRETVDDADRWQEKLRQNSAEAAVEEALEDVMFVLRDRILWVISIIEQDPHRPDGGQPKAATGGKRSTEPGEGRVKLIAALTKHHKYADGSCLNPEPIGNNELARQVDVSVSTASKFFKEEFEGHTKYRALCGDATRLVVALKLLNQEFSPHLLCGNKPPGEDNREDE